MTTTDDRKKLKREPREQQQQQQNEIVVRIDVDEEKNSNNKTNTVNSSNNKRVEEAKNYLVNSDDYILTNFNTADEESNDLATLNRLFYGEKFLKQRRELVAIASANADVANNNSTKSLVNNSSKKKQQAAKQQKGVKHQEESINERFVRLHRSKEVKSGGFNGSRTSRYDDQSLSDDEPIFKIGKNLNIDYFQIKTLNYLLTN